jgi:peptide/nickel transport system permease protein
MKRKRSRSSQDRQEAYFTATQWKLIWLKFRRHRWAVVGFWVIFVLYVVAIFAGFFATNDAVERRPEYRYLPPARIHFRSETGSLGLYVYKLTSRLNLQTYEREFVEDTSVAFPLRFFVAGDPYKLLGLFRTNTRLIGTGDEVVRFFPLGTDGSGRCLYSRIVHGATISLSIGVLAIFIHWILGLFFGAISGYFGGIVDNVIQRIIEVIMSFPHLPLWMALSASLPLTWSVLRIYLAITIILSLMGWTGLARTVRSKFLALREEEFIVAARLDGARTTRLMFRHMLPQFASHLIVSASSAVPGMILGETSLSFLGLGLRAPAISWGVLLQEAQNVESVALRPWLLIPSLFVILVVVAFQFLGDGLRDAADPYR